MMRAASDRLPSARTVGSLFVLCVVAAALVGAGGAAAQTTETPTPTPTPAPTDAAIANDTVAVDNDTRSVYADLTAGESSVDLEVTFSGENVTDDTRSVSLNASEDRLVEWTAVDASTQDEVRVVVTAPNVDSTNATAEVGTIQKVAGGGGGGLLGGGGGGSLGSGVILVVVLGAYWWVSGGDD